MNEKNCVISLPGSSPAAMMIVKEEEVVMQNVVGSGTELSLTVRLVFKDLRPALKSLCFEYDVPSHWLLEAVKHSSRDIFHGVLAGISDLMYSTRQTAEVLHF